MKTEIIQVEERGFTELFLLALQQRSFKRFPDKFQVFLTNVDSARRERAGWENPPASGTNQIAGFVEFRPLKH